MNDSLNLADNTDRTDIVALLNALHLPTSDLPQTLNDFIIFKDDNKVLGTCGLEVYGTFALLRSLAVAPGSQSKGLGDALLQATLELAKEKGVQEIYLITNSATNFFAKRGFTQVERSLVPAAIQNTAQFSSVCPTSATVMYRQLNQFFALFSRNITINR